MLWVCTDLSKFQEFREMFKTLNSSVTCVDISTVVSDMIVENADSILQHHTDSCVFLGYVEPGWMLDLSHQTRIRKLIREYEVGLVCNFTDSLPFSWKNEIRTLYT